MKLCSSDKCYVVISAVVISDNCNSVIYCIKHVVS